jgi:hypothetical protein
MIPYHEMPLHLEHQTIRLLELNPYSQEHEEGYVECSVRVATLDDFPEFSALSYTWGDPKRRKQILVDGITVSVTENLESALRHLRNQTHPVDLWIDALCIDQGNDVEKAEQVTRMHEVYTRAKCTIVWLGPEADGSNIAIKALRDTGVEANARGVMEMNATKMSLGSLSEDESRRQNEVIASIDEMAKQIHYNYPFKAIRKLYERPYWSRLWVVQEYTLAAQISMRCGNETMSGNDFAAGYLFLPLLQKHLIQSYGEEDLTVPMDPSADYEQELNDDGTVVPRIWHLLKNGSVPRPGGLIGVRRRYGTCEPNPTSRIAMARLFDLLEKSSVVRDVNDTPLGAAVAKDRVFGLLGVVGKSAELGFDVDYSVSDEKVFTDVARALLLENQLGVLSYARLHTGVEMPSWAPDWRANLVDPCAQKGFFKPTGDGHVPTPVVKDDNTLTFEGLTVDTIRHLGTAWQPETHGGKFEWANAAQLFKEVHSLVSSKERATDLPVVMSVEKWRESTWRIPVADQYMNDIGLRTRAPPAAFEGWKLVSKGSVVLTESANNGMSDLNYYQMAMGNLHGRRLVQTRKGFVGLAPVDVQLGDVVCLLVGTGSPFVLRPMTGQSAYQIVGEAYFYGIMDGEMVSTETVYQSFDIC